MFLGIENRWFFRIKFMMNESIYLFWFLLFPHSLSLKLIFSDLFSLPEQSIKNLPRRRLSRQKLRYSGLKCTRFDLFFLLLNFLLKSILNDLSCILNQFLPHLLPWFLNFAPTASINMTRYLMNLGSECKILINILLFPITCMIILVMFSYGVFKRYGICSVVFEICCG